MVGERRPLSIHVEATSGRAVSSEAVSLGLIVTELVINALKHAFPSGCAQGAILVKYENDESGWRLSVSDNGDGIGEAGANGVHTGLGTSIVEALAQQLNAKVRKSAGPEGTTVLDCIRSSAALSSPHRIGTMLTKHSAARARPCFHRDDFGRDLATETRSERPAIVQRNPLASIGIGLGVGFMLGLVLSGRN